MLLQWYLLKPCMLSHSSAWSHFSPPEPLTRFANRSLLHCGGNFLFLIIKLLLWRVSQYGWIYWSLLQLYSYKCCNYANRSVHCGLVVLLLRTCANHSECFVTGRQCAWSIIWWRKTFRQAIPAPQLCRTLQTHATLIMLSSINARFE